MRRQLPKDRVDLLAGRSLPQAVNTRFTENHTATALAVLSYCAGGIFRRSRDQPCQITPRFFASKTGLESRGLGLETYQPCQITPRNILRPLYPIAHVAFSVAGRQAFTNNSSGFLLPKLVAKAVG
jgi:hypothetical protein